MFAKVNVPVLGLVENMAGYVTPSGEKVDLFGAGGGKSLEEKYKIPLLGSIPIDISIREGGDKGMPAVLDDESSAKVFRSISEQLLSKLTETKNSAKQVSISN